MLLHNSPGPGEALPSKSEVVAEAVWIRRHPYVVAVGCDTPGYYPNMRGTVLQSAERSADFRTRRVFRTRR